MTGTKLFIGNLPDTVDKDELEAMFRKFGNVVEFDILKDYGFVHYENESEAKDACDALDGKVHRGSNIRVEVSRSKVRQKAGMGGKGECYRCGAEGHWSKECPRGPTRAKGGRNSNRGGRGSGRYNPYDRDPFYPPPPLDPYDFYRSRAGLPPYGYDRYHMEYERRLPPYPRDTLYRDFEDRDDYFRRSSPPRDPYYEYYERRRLAALDAYRDSARSPGPSAATGSSSDMQSISRLKMESRVPGPY